MIHVAVGILINSAGDVLIAQRPAHTSSAGLWEFPGGKVELNEDGFEALCRELHEEIGIKVTLADPWFQIQHTYPERTVLLDNWLVKEFTGEPYGAEGQLIRWVKPGELNQFQFPAGNRLIIEKLLKLS